MNHSSESFRQRYKPHIVFVIAGSVGVALAIVLEISVFWLIFAVLVIMAASVVTMFAKMSGLIDSLLENSSKLESLADFLEKNRAVLVQIDQNTRLSDIARTIAFRDAEAQTLRGAVLEKLQQHDFETTGQMIDEIGSRAGYSDLATELRGELERYRDATDQERINQIIEYIEKLFENHQWAMASAQINKLTASYPNSDKANMMRNNLIERKQLRKKELLAAWDDAVKRHDTDRSLELLKELDLYLTPNEGLALQEAARDVFRTKLHNLGVQFSMSVSEKNWAEAIRIGAAITRDFPNSRMAEEIREKWKVLSEKAGPPSTER